MLISLKKKADPVREPGAFDLLLECHERIRRFTSMAEWLAHATPATVAPEHGAPEAAVKETAEAVLRYFTVALPHHSADEDRSLAPRMLALPLGDELASAVRRMTDQHTTLEETIASLVPAWRAVAADPAALLEHSAPMARHVERLRGLWDTHLHLEEMIVFPAARLRIAASDQREMLLEMRARRT